MNYIFEIIDKSGKKIRLTKKQWSHITIKHSYMADKLEDIKKALTSPALIVSHKFSDDMRNYYLHYKDKSRYLLVSVKYLNGGGYVTTSFITRNIIRR